MRWFISVATSWLLTDNRSNELFDCLIYLLRYPLQLTSRHTTLEVKLYTTIYNKVKTS